MPQGEVLLRHRDLRALPAHRPALRALRQDVLPDARALDRLGRGAAALAHHAPTATTTSRPASSSWRSARPRRAKLPGIPGIDDVRGPLASTPAAGTTTTPAATRPAGMTGLADKRVAIIGTGATAIQCVPRVGAVRRAPLRVPAHAVVGRLARQQADRSRVVGVAGARLAARAAGELRRRSPPGQPVEVDLVDDGWTDIFRNVVSSPRRAPTGRRAEEERSRVVELADFRQDEPDPPARRRDGRGPGTAEALKPWYRQMCKRPTFNDEFLPCFNRDNVTLVDVSEAKGVERITPTGVVANGEEYEVDCIIYASGFEISSDVPAPPRHRGQRPRRAVAVRPLGRRAEDAARLLHPRLPELVLHRRLAERASAST